MRETEADPSGKATYVRNTQFYQSLSTDPISPHSYCDVLDIVENRIILRSFLLPFSFPDCDIGTTRTSCGRGNTRIGRGIGTTIGIEIEAWWSAAGIGRSSTVGRIEGGGRRARSRKGSAIERPSTRKIARDRRSRDRRTRRKGSARVHRPEFEIATTIEQPLPPPPLPRPAPRPPPPPPPPQPPLARPSNHRLVGRNPSRARLSRNRRRAKHCVDRSTLEPASNRITSTRNEATGIRCRWRSTRRRNITTRPRILPRHRRAPLFA